MSVIDLRQLGGGGAPVPGGRASGAAQRRRLV
jgi:hypothetical protein